MNREETKTAIVIMQAWLDGKSIEWTRKHIDNVPWRPVEGEPLWFWNDNEYRIKPKAREWWLDPTDGEVLQQDTPPNSNFIKVREVL